MTTSNQLNPGMVLNISNKLFRVESSVRVTAPKGAPFIKTKLKDMSTGKVVEKNFKLNQALKDVALLERRLEFLYLEGKNYLFLDIENLEQVLVPPDIIGKKANYLKEGVELRANLYGDAVFSIELPQFLELMVSKTETAGGATPVANVTKMAILETGARIEVPPFIEAGDIVKVDTKTDEYIQRV
jgi:elongation factor P